jgi:hypothetical protein
VIKCLEEERDLARGDVESLEDERDALRERLKVLWYYKIHSCSLSYFLAVYSLFV